ncbi:DUF3265 domain-containing protein [Vibrio parahaemolyticus]|nr:DUF3265 domain-containing protein [Vibrio parahaemolyticus]EGQ8893112.1 DUF3265 domain-containing protein [Vibrio parahaemolyticus]EGQ8967201.1 DUF3265 domain-containing protein [Vibrio parahaemolyticus]EGR2854845.1 DUF3265 domain-containing protein [Vibrio parahaemolyticus]EGR3169373.1 DUF3265 domain-containing protein [Vibrio parahaemolyticus]
MIRNAWHFYYAFILVFKVVCGDFGNCVAHTLTGRYESPRFQRYKIKRLGYGKRKKDRTTSSGFN